MDRRYLNYAWRAAIGVAACAMLAASPPARAETAQMIHVGNILREYFVFMPDRLRGRQRAAPLLVVLHGGGGNAQQIRRFLPFDEIARRDGVIVVYPQGVEKHWNDGRLTTRDRAHRENIDDVKFIKTLVDVVDRQHATVDYTRIYAIGISNGGMMTLRLACEAPDRFRAVAAFTANLPEPVPPLCRAAVAVGVLMMNGTADPLVPYDGGQVRFGRRTLGAVISTDATMALFARRNGCTAQPSTTDLPDVDPADQTRVVRLEWTGCRAPVVLYRIDGGGHTWPGRAQYLPQFMVGKVSRDIDGTEVAWAFLKAQARR